MESQDRKLDKIINSLTPSQLNPNTTSLASPIEPRNFFANTLTTPPIKCLQLHLSSPQIRQRRPQPDQMISNDLRKEFHKMILGSTRKRENKTILLIQKINTLPTSKCLKFMDLMYQAHYHDIDIMLLTEINEPLKLSNYEESYSSKLRYIWPQANLTITPALSNQILRRAGGVENFNLTASGRIIKFTSDPYSLWQTNFLYAKNDLKIYIITSYFPCFNSNPKPATNNFLLFNKLQVKHKFQSPGQLQQACWKDFEEYIHQLQVDNTECIIEMETNSKLQDPKSLVSKFITSCDLSDCIKEHCPEKQNISTYTCSVNRIDCFLTTKYLAGNISK